MIFQIPEQFLPTGYWPIMIALFVTDLCRFVLMLITFIGFIHWRSYAWYSAMIFFPFTLFCTIFYNIIRTLWSDGDGCPDWIHSPSVVFWRLDSLLHPDLLPEAEPPLLSAAGGGAPGPGCRRPRRRIPLSQSARLGSAGTAFRHSGRKSPGNIVGDAARNATGSAAGNTVGAPVLPSLRHTSGAGILPPLPAADHAARARSTVSRLRYGWLVNNRKGGLLWEKEISAGAGPSLHYTVTRVRLPLLYCLCKESLRKAPEQTVKESYTSIAPDPWVALDAYCRSPEGGTTHWYLLCYENCFVEPAINWSPTPEQMARIAGQLGRLGTS